MMMMAVMGGLSLLLPMVMGGGGPLAGLLGGGGAGASPAGGAASSQPVPTTGGRLLPELPAIRPRAPSTAAPAAAATASFAAPAAPAPAAPAPVALPRSSRYFAGQTQNAGALVTIVTPAAAPTTAASAAPANPYGTSSMSLADATAQAQAAFRELQEALAQGNTPMVAQRRQAYEQAKLRLDAAIARSAGN